MISPSLALPISTELWHLRAPLERERWQKDGWPRYFCTQLLLLPQSANTGTCIRPEEACVWRGGETISSVTNLVFTPGQEGKVIQWPAPPLSPSAPPPPIHSLTHTKQRRHTESFCQRRPNTHMRKGVFPSKQCRAVCAWLCVEFTVACESHISTGCSADFGAYVAISPDPGIYWSWLLFWPGLTLSSIVQSLEAAAAATTANTGSFDQSQVWFILRSIQFN